LTVKVGAENDTSHTWSQRCPTEMRECLIWLGKRCAFFAKGGRPGSASVAVWVDYMIVPSINVADNGCNDFYLCTHSASNARKFPVTLESKMAELHKFLDGVELR
jgi:hypothetical protein